ncbi:cytochrome c3 family protein [Nitrosophilus labii]|uniref:cytochrome c3 family protein n=1 Tax=Nitrosophilus labii TaxID=2706014 RepID=UPI0016572235|nr:cytochrome c3 family protein [Nitrosophilus labii]
MNKKGSYKVFLLIFSILFLISSLFSEEIKKDDSSFVASLVKKVSNKYFSVIVPFKNNVFEEQFVTVTVKVFDKSIDKIVLRTSYNIKYEIEVKEDKDTYCKTLMFFIGENFVKVYAYKNGKKVEKETIKFFNKAFLSKYYKIVPNGYKKEFFHNNLYEQACSECHDMSVNEESGIAFENVEKSNCYNCHKNLLSRKYAHAPTVNFVCLPCHNGETGTKNRALKDKSKFIYPDPIGPLCLKCHTKKRKLWSMKMVKHDPVGAGKCNKCHNPHSSGISKYFLRKSVWRLCTTCHTDKTSKRAYLSLFKKKKDMGEIIDKKFLKGSFDCVDCHNPHASNRRFLLLEKIDNIKDVCISLTESGGRW